MKDVAIGELASPTLFFFLKVAWLFSVSSISVFNIFLQHLYPKTCSSTPSHPSVIWGWVCIEFANRPQENLHFNSELSPFPTCYNMYLISLSSVWFYRCFEHILLDLIFVFNFFILLFKLLNWQNLVYCLVH